MESYFEEIGVETRGRVDFRNITGRVLEAVRGAPLEAKVDKAS